MASIEMPTRVALHRLVQAMKACTPGSILEVVLHSQHEQAPFYVKVEWVEEEDGQVALGVFTHKNGEWLRGRSILIVPSLRVVHYLIPYYDAWDKMQLDVHHVWHCVEKIEACYVQS